MKQHFLEKGFGVESYETRLPPWVLLTGWLVLFTVGWVVFTGDFVIAGLAWLVLFARYGKRALNSITLVAYVAVTPSLVRRGWLEDPDVAIIREAILEQLEWAKSNHIVISRATLPLHEWLEMKLERELDIPLRVSPIGENGQIKLLISDRKGNVYDTIHLSEGYGELFTVTFPPVSSRI